jgi:hypothetical protein
MTFPSTLPAHKTESASHLTLISNVCRDLALSLPTTLHVDSHPHGVFKLHGAPP